MRYRVRVTFVRTFDYIVDADNAEKAFEKAETGAIYDDAESKEEIENRRQTVFAVKANGVGAEHGAGDIDA